MSAIGTLTLGTGVSAEAVVAALRGFAEQGARVAVIETAADADVAGWKGERVRWLWRDYPLPVVFAFEGRLAGAGAALALGCDLRVCAEGAVIELVGGAMDDPTADRARTLLGLEAGEAIPSRFTGREALEAGLVSRMGARGARGRWRGERLRPSRHGVRSRRDWPKRRCGGGSRSRWNRPCGSRPI